MKPLTELCSCLLVYWCWSTDSHILSSLYTVTYFHLIAPLVCLIVFISEWSAFLVFRLYRYMLLLHSGQVGPLHLSLQIQESYCSSHPIQITQLFVCPFFKASILEISTGSPSFNPSLLYKRDVWEISFNHKTRIFLLKIILQLTDLLCSSDFIVFFLSDLAWFSQRKFPIVIHLSYTLS